MVTIIAALLAQLLSAPVESETIAVAGGGVVDLAGFECRDIGRSTIVQRVCYEASRRELIVAAGGAYHRYCSVPPGTAEALLGAPSMGQYFNREVRSEASRFACRAG